MKPRYRFAYDHGYWVSAAGVPAPLDKRWKQRPGPCLYPPGFWPDLMRGKKDYVVAKCEAT